MNQISGRYTALHLSQSEVHKCNLIEFIYVIFSTVISHIKYKSLAQSQEFYLLFSVVFGLSCSTVFREKTSLKHSTVYINYDNYLLNPSERPKIACI